MISNIFDAPVRAGALALLALFAIAMLGCHAGALSSPDGSGARLESTGSERAETLVVHGHHFAKRRLANGLTALAVAEPGADTASVYLAYAVGTAMESPDASGLAHLTEHALFSGTHSVPDGQHEALVREWGGDANAYTRDDYTLYYDDRIPPSRVERVLEMEADRMRGLTFEASAVQREQTRLVEEERNMASDQVRRAGLVDRAVFGERGYGASVPDTDGRTNAGALDIASIRAFYDTWYHPNHAAVVVAGAVEPPEALDWIEAAFAGIPAGPERSVETADRPTPTDEPREIRIPADLSEQRLVHSWRGPARCEPDGSVRDRAALHALAVILERRHPGVRATASPRLRPDRFSIAGAGDEVDSLLSRVTRSVLTRPIGSGELEQARAAIAEGIQSAPLRGRPYFSLAAGVAIDAALGDPDHGVDYLEAVAALQPEDVSAAAARWIAPAEVIAVRFVPDGSADAEVATALPDDPRDLSAYAERAADSGDLDAAAAAYRKLADRVTSKQYQVIALYSLAVVERDRKRLGEASAALERALAIVDYPAVRALLEEIEGQMAGRRTASSAKIVPATQQPHGEPRASHGIAHPERLDPEIVRAAERYMGRIEAWRGLPFLEDLRLEYGVEGTEDEKLAGFYSPEEKRLVVMAGRSETFSHGTLLHEIFHALQDQHFDLARLHAEAEGLDAERALSSLIEGEAMLAVSELMDYDFLSHSELFPSGPLDRDRFSKVFRYAEGMRMVMALREEGGWALVDEAWQRPPVRTLEVLRPELWIRRARSAEGELAERAEGETGKRAEGEPDEGEERGLGAYSLCLLLGESEAAQSEARELAGQLVRDRIEPLHGNPVEGERRWTLEFENAAAARRLRRLAEITPGVTEALPSSNASEVVLRLNEAWKP